MNSQLSMDTGLRIEADLVRNQADLDYVGALLARGIEDRSALFERVRRLEDERCALLEALSDGEDC